jgi:hypothetical protein
MNVQPIICTVLTGGLSKLIFRLHLIDILILCVDFFFIKRSFMCKIQTLALERVAFANESCEILSVD